MSLVLIAAALLQGASAAPPPPAAAPPAVRKPRGSLFIAPSGEPFRGAAGEPYPVVAWLARADCDHDGRLTRGEFRRDYLTFFAALDVNKDGVIDGKEIERYEQELVPEVQVNFGSGPEFRALQELASSGAPVGGSGGDEPSAEQQRRSNARLEALPRGGGRYGLINVPEPVVSMDADLSRRITPQEFSAAADRRFTLLDPDERGYLTLATLPKTPIQARFEGGVVPTKRR